MSQQDGDRSAIPYYADNAFKEHGLPAVAADLKVAFIGNSLTWHEPTANIGWPHSHGMAASATGHDYAHRLLAQLRLTPQQAYIRNFYPFESELAVADGHLASLAEVWERKPPLVVIQLGDNIGNQEQLNAFAQNLQRLVHAARLASPHVFCISTWWQSPAKDYVIERVCQLYGAEYVFIGDLFTHPANTDRLQPTYGHQGVEAHPKDWGMAQIAERLYGAIIARLLRSPA
ncbi:SGNH/GDSL hydrolase family protein [Oxalobacteraceae bacterium A2-2]